MRTNEKERGVSQSNGAQKLQNADSNLWISQFVKRARYQENGKEAEEHTVCDISLDSEDGVVGLGSAAPRQSMIAELSTGKGAGRK